MPGENRFEVPTSDELADAKLKSRLALMERMIDELREKVEKEPDTPMQMGGTSLDDLIASGVEHDHSWHVSKDSTTGVTFSTGAVYLDGASKTITSWPTDGIVTDITTTTHYWIAIDMSAGTATWGSGASLPANTATVEYWEIAVITCTDEEISGIKECEQSDIHIAPGA